jgi:hypothetical protein
MGQSHLLGKKTFKPEGNPILLNIENIDRLLSFLSIF